jgi:hypothetical protein
MGLQGTRSHPWKKTAGEVVSMLPEGIVESTPEGSGSAYSIPYFLARARFASSSTDGCATAICVHGTGMPKRAARSVCFATSAGLNKSKPVTMPFACFRARLFRKSSRTRPGFLCLSRSFCETDRPNFAALHLLSCVAGHLVILFFFMEQSAAGTGYQGVLQGSRSF